jgi:hypothetical protein
MKNKLLFAILIFSSISFAQFQDQFPRPCQGYFGGGLGLNWIDGELYYTLRFMPEISLGNFGAGLDLRLDFDKNGNLRKEDFNEFSDYLSIIRYVRYGLKNDPVYVKLGALDYYTLGHGSVMYQYNNSPSLDVRKIGLVFDVDFGNFGLESIYSRFAEAGVVGIRGYVRPLKFSEVGAIPIIGDLEVGATYAGDYDKHAGVVSGYYDPATETIQTTSDEGSINIVGVDIGFPIVSNPLVSLKIYADYTKIINFGSGVATGIIFTSSGLGITTISAKLERRFNNDHYLPSYFNSFYEIQRFQVNTSTSSIQSKAQILASTFDPGNGYYGELGINVAGIFNILGSYQRLDKYPESGILHLTTDISPEDLSFIARAGYDKINIKDEKDLFTLDDRSYLYAELGYKPYPFMIVSMVYSWTYAPVRDKDDNIIDYKPQKRIEPRVSFVFPFDLGCQ